MKRSNRFIIVGIILLGGITAFAAFRFANRSVPQTARPATSQGATPTPTVELVDWKDPAGFSFKYPKGLVVDKHDEDKENYAHIEFTDPSHPGSVIVWAKDTTAADAAGWVKADKTLSGAASVDTTLGGLSAKKVVVSGETRSMTVGTVSDGIVFSVVAASPEGDYWQGVLETITGSFVFDQEEGAPATGEAPTTAGGDVSVDEEEVVE